MRSKEGQWFSVLVCDWGAFSVSESFYRWTRFEFITPGHCVWNFAGGHNRCFKHTGEVSPSSHHDDLLPKKPHQHSTLRGNTIALRPEEIYNCSCYKIDESKSATSHIKHDFNISPEREVRKWGPKRWFRQGSRGDQFSRLRTKTHTSSLNFLSTTNSYHRVSSSQAISSTSFLLVCIYQLLLHPKTWDLIGIVLVPTLSRCFFGFVTLPNHSCWTSSRFCSIYLANA